MGNELVEKIRKIVIDVCKQLERLDDYNYHISVVENLAVDLGKRFGADEEILRIAALLHDIGRIKFGPERHEETGAIEAEKILKELKLEEKTIEKIIECIKEHRHEKPTIPVSLEAKILKIADAYSHFKKPLEIAYMAVKMGFGLEESLFWMKNKLEKDLKFLKEMSNELDIKDVIKECEKKYECFSCLLS
jgi:putative nucleotidyltransferase with HDIG domain